MLINLIPLSLLVLGMMAYAVYRSFKRREVSRAWQVAFFGAMLMGFAVGVYFGFFFQYSPRSGFKVCSFPVPAAFLILEEKGDGKSEWTDFITPAPLLYAGANVPIFACLAVIPIWVLNTLSRMFLVRGQSQLAPVDISRPSKQPLTEHDQHTMSTPTRKRWLRFSLGTMLAVVTVLCVLLALKVRQVERQREVVEWLQTKGARVWYDYEFRDGTWICKPDLPGPDWLCELVGIDYFTTLAVIGVNCERTRLGWVNLERRADGPSRDLDLMVLQAVIKATDEDIAILDATFPRCLILTEQPLIIEGEL